MGDLTADLFVSLDGFGLGVGYGPYFDYPGPELNEWIETELDRPQRIVLGRVTYEMLAPTSQTEASQASGRLTDLPKVVTSSSLSEPLDWANTRLVSGDARETLPELKRESDVPLRTMGSISLVRSLRKAGVVDRLRLMVFPLTCGSAGREPVFEDGKEERLELQRAAVLDERIVLLEYGMEG